MYPWVKNTDFMKLWLEFNILRSADLALLVVPKKKRKLRGDWAYVGHLTFFKPFSISVWTMCCLLLSYLCKWRIQRHFLRNSVVVSNQSHVYIVYIVLVGSFM